MQTFTLPRGDQTCRADAEAGVHLAQLALNEEGVQLDLIHRRHDFCVRSGPPGASG
jgi:hypothetical protein